MMNYKYILLIVLFLTLSSKGQNVVLKNTIEDDFSNLKFEITNIDSVVTHHVSGEYNSPNFRSIDSTKIWADIILIDAPNTINPVRLKIKIEAIMKDNKINIAFVFRDKNSSMLFRLSSLYAAQKLKERNGYLGEFNIE